MHLPFSRPVAVGVPWCIWVRSQPAAVGQNLPFALGMRQYQTLSDIYHRDEICGGGICQIHVYIDVCPYVSLYVRTSVQL